jgi:hypothetical protein
MKLYAQFYKKDLSGTIVEKTGMDGIVKLDGRTSLKNAIESAKKQAISNNEFVNDIVGFRLMSGSLLSPSSVSGFIKI